MFAGWVVVWPGREVCGMELQIHHMGERDGRPVFTVIRSRDGKRTEEVCLPEPEAFPLKEHSSRKFLPELRWYLEEYLQAPFGAYLHRAACVSETMRDWGRAVFDTLFAGRGRDWYQEAKRAGLEQLRLKIVSDSAAVMSWPWEAIYSAEDGFLALRCHMERQLSEIGDPPSLSSGLSEDAFHILYILARPYGEEDVSYHSLAGRFVEDIRGNGLCAVVDVLRPPTFDRLRQVLYEKRGYYHIVHFDGHGGYGEEESGRRQYLYGGPEGQLMFETEEGKPDGISAALLAQLLAEFQIPVMVMNACQSGMIDEQAQDPFASVAAGLLKAGIRSVVAMGYSLYVSGAREFVPAFYNRLFATGRISEAVRAGRTQMLRQQERSCIVGKMPLQDWIVPVLYQQGGEEELLLPLQACRKEETGEYPQRLPESVQDTGEYGFIGRGQYIQKLERAMLHQKQAALLVHGQAGVGKTTLAGGFLRWLQDTGGLCEQVFWFDFREIHSAESVINSLLTGMGDFNRTAMRMEEKLPYLSDLMRRKPYIVVWDNFESASGIAGTERVPLLDQDNRAVLFDLLRRLRGGKTKILITSRTPEQWLSIQNCYPIALSGFSGEELWEYCNAVVQDLELTLDRKNPTYRRLLDRLDGNPLAIRAILLRLQSVSAEQLLAELETAFAGAEGDESTRRLQAACAVFGERLMERFLPIFQLTGLHERYVDTDLLRSMLNVAGIDAAEEIADCFRILEEAGFCSDWGQSVYQMHPALRGYLLNRAPAPEILQRVFAEGMGELAYYMAGEPLSVTGNTYEIHLSNFYAARRLAELWDIKRVVLALTKSLAYFAYERRQFAEASALYLSLVEKSKLYEDENMLSVAFHQLGILAQERRDLGAAEEWYRKSLELSQKQGNEYRIAASYHQLGRIAGEQWEFAAAKEWYQKSLEINERKGNEQDAVRTYYQLGRIAEEQRDFAAAEGWFRKSLEVSEKQKNEEMAAIVYHGLGSIAQEQKDFEGAEKWYQKSLKIRKKQGDEYEMAYTCHQLGMLAQERKDFTAAEKWYQKSLEIKERRGNERETNSTYHQLGILAQTQGNFTEAEEWYQKSLEISERQGNKYGAALTCHQLGILAQAQGNFTEAEEWYRKSLKIKEEQGNEYGIAGTCYQLGLLFRQQEDFAAAEKWCVKCLEIEEKFGDEDGAASTCYQLGLLFEEQQDFSAAADAYLKAMPIWEQADDSEDFMDLICSYSRMLRSAPAEEAVSLQKRLEEQASSKAVMLVRENLEEEKR